MSAFARLCALLFLPSPHLALRRALALLAGLVLLALGAALPARAQGTAVPGSILGQPVQQVAVGWYHGCALTTAGAVYCWGRNHAGQLGDGTTVDNPLPRPVVGLASGVVALVAGAWHSCALTTAGAVQCWGFPVGSTPQPVPGLSAGVAALAAGDEHTCALTTAGTVQCWGVNRDGQLGNGSTTDASTPQPVTGLASGVAAIAAGGRHTCALSMAGAAQCWGYNDNGQLGDGSTTSATTPRPVTGLASGVAAIAAGGTSTCALSSAGAVQCWGQNSYGQLGNGGSADASTPQPASGLASGVAALEAGVNHACALTTAGALQCWGSNSNGQLGNASPTATFTTPQAVADLASGVRAIAAGGNHSCAVTTAGAVHCWGWNNYGQLGNGNTTDANTPQPVAVLGGAVKAFAGGFEHTCAVSASGGVYCWGSNSGAQLGNGGFTSTGTPQAVTGLSTGVAAVAAGYGHSCALTTEGAVKCWGENAGGQLGDGTTTRSTTPKAVLGLPGPAQAVVTSGSTSCALIAASGAVYCWGVGVSGQLGNGTNTSYSTAPVPVQGLQSGTTSLSAGGRHLCAINAAQEVVCWGENYAGAFALTGSSYNTPITNPGLSGSFAAVAAGGMHTCALSTAGAVKCWGDNAYGQVGNGTMVPYNIAPRDVVGMGSGVTAIATSTISSCAITSDGAAWCWGGNYNTGMVGNGSSPDASRPMAVTGLASGVQSLMTGHNHACALTTAGALQCWGKGNAGQLGNDSVASPQRQPVPIVAGQTIDFATPVPLPAQGTSSTTLAATASSGLAVQFESWTPDVCTVSGTTLTVLPGKTDHWCGVQARQPGLSTGPVAAPAQARLMRVQSGVPDAPTAVVASAGNAQATVGWTAPAYAGSSALTRYTVTTVEDNTKTCSVTTGSPLATTCTVTGLANGTAYTFTARATNAAGDSEASAPSTTPVVPATVPGAPTALAATAGDAQAVVRWTAPASNGGSALTAVTVSAVQDSTKTCSVTTGSPLATTCTVLGLTNGTAYTFTAKATNAAGDSVPSAASAPATPTAPPAGGGGGGGPAGVTINTPGTSTTITDPTQPITVGPDAAGATLVLPGTGTAPVTLQLAVNGQSLTVTALPGAQLQVAQVKGQTVLVLVVLQGSASMTSTAPGQPMSLAGEVLLSSGAAGTRIDAQPLAVAVVSGSLVPPNGSLPELGGKGLQAGERLQIDATGKLVSITLGSIKGDGTQPGDTMVFANLPTSITVDGKVFARIAGTVPRLAGANLTQGLEVTASGVLLLRDGTQVLQLLPTQPITIDARLPDGVSFTPLGLLRWVRGGVVVQFAPAVADLAGLASAVTAVLPDAKLKLGAEGVIQLTTGGATYVLRPDWAGAGTATGTPQIGVDAQGRIYLQIGTGAKQLLLPALLSPTQAQAIFTAALPGSALALRSGASDGSLTLTLGGTQWRLVPQWVLPSGNDAAQTTPWRLGADGVLYLKLGTQVQGVKIAD